MFKIKGRKKKKQYTSNPKQRNDNTTQSKSYFGSIFFQKRICFLPGNYKEKSEKLKSNSKSLTATY